MCHSEGAERPKNLGGEGRIYNLSIWVRLSEQESVQRADDRRRSKKNGERIL